MKKRIIPLLLTILLIAIPISIFSVDRSNRIYSDNYKVSDQSDYRTPSTIDDMNKTISNEALAISKSLVPQVYAKNDLCVDSSKGGLNPFMLNCNATTLAMSPNNGFTGIYIFSAILSKTPTVNIRTTDVGTVYLTYMLDSGEWIYLFFNRFSEYLSGYPILMSKVLSHSDFQSLSVGDSIKDVAKIDPVASYAERAIRETMDTYPTFLTSGYFAFTDIKTAVSNHLLKDGFLQIEYSLGADDSLNIEAIHFYEDFRVPNKYFIPGVTSPEMEYDIYKIYPQDYVTELITIDPPPAGFGESEKPEPKLWDEVAWSIDITSDGKTRTLTSSDAARLPTVQIIESTWTTDKENGGVTTSFYEGAELTDVLKSVGVGGFNEIEVVGFNGEKRVYDRETLMKNKTIVAWIENKKFAITDSETGVALATDGGSPDEFIRSVRELIVR